VGREGLRRRKKTITSFSGKKKKQEAAVESGARNLSGRGMTLTTLHQKNRVGSWGGGGETPDRRQSSIRETGCPANWKSGEGGRRFKTRGEKKGRPRREVFQDSRMYGGRKAKKLVFSLGEKGVSAANINGAIVSQQEHLFWETIIVGGELLWWVSSTPQTSSRKIHCRGGNPLGRGRTRKKQTKSN